MSEIDRSYLSLADDEHRAPQDPQAAEALIAQLEAASPFAEMRARFEAHVQVADSEEGR